MPRIGRPTLDKKDCTLKLRLNEEMREYVDFMSSLCGISMSEYMRELIRLDMSRRQFPPKNKKESP